MSADAARGKASIDSKDYQSAVNYFTEALKSSKAPSWLLQRSTAYHRLGQYKLALDDAHNALHVAINRGKRELIAEAHYRRGIVLHGLKQYGDARMCFFWARKYNEKLPGLSMWISKVQTDYDVAGGDQAGSNAITVKEVPELAKEIEKKDDSPNLPQTYLNKGGENFGNNISVDNTNTDTPRPNSKIRHEWYQSQNTVTVEILAKAIPKEVISVDIQETSLDVSFPISSAQSTCNFSFAPLFSKVDVSKSSYRVTPHKIEIILHKSNSGLKWSSLENLEPVSVEDTGETNTQDLKNDLKDLKIQSQAPVYPTSSRTGPKNWDTLVGKEADDEDDGPDAFFKMLYKNADPDTKRAMVKSYQESNGTSLSTQWSDVGSRKFEVIPPDGVEVKKWDT